MFDRSSHVKARTAAILTATVVVAGAFPDTSFAQAAPTVRDSAGIRIVEHASVRNSPSAFKLGPTPWLQLGGLQANPDEELSSKQPFLAPTLISAGRIAVADWSSIKFFDRTGAFLGSSGRNGLGPGEFVQVGRLCRLPNETLLAIDYSNRRLSIWSHDGKLVKTYASVGLLASDPCFPDGTLLVRRPPRGQRSAAAGQHMAYFSRVRHDGTLIADLGAFPTDEYGPIVRQVSVVPAADRIYVADAKRYEVRVQSLTGQLIWILRVNTPPVEVTRARWRAEAESQAPKDQPPAQREAQIAEFMSMKHPATYPAFRRVRVDAAGRIWIQDYEALDLWTVFDSTGALLGSARMPRFQGVSARLATLDQDNLVTLHSDDDGAPRLSFYRLTLSSITR